jgi:hypothetical protein
MARLTSVFSLGHPDIALPDGEWPTKDLTAHWFGEGHVDIVLDDEERGYGGDGWGVYMTLTSAEAAKLAIDLIEAVRQCREAMRRRTQASSASDQEP